MGGEVSAPRPGRLEVVDVYGDSLTFEKLGGQEPNCSLTVSKGLCEPSVFVVKPWHRVD